MIGPILGDLSKLRRPLTLWLTLGAAALVLLTAIMSQESASRQWQIAQDNLKLLKTNPPPPSAYGLASSGPEYDRVYRQDLRDAHRFIAETREISALVGATQHPVGALGFALGQLCSGIGALIVLFLAAGHVSGEWSLRTIKDVLIADGRRGYFVAYKSVSVFVASLWFVLFTWVVLILWGLISQRIYPIPGRAPTSAVADWTLPRLEVAPLILATVSVAAVLLAILMRSVLGTVLAGTIVVALLNVVTRSSALERYSPASWIASLMGYQRRQYLIDHVWAEQSISLTTTTAAVGLGLGMVVLLSVAIVWMRRSDVLS